MKKNIQILDQIIIVTCGVIGLVLRILYLNKYRVFTRDAYTYKVIIESWIQTGKYPDEIGTPPLSLFLFRLSSKLFNVDIIQGGIILNMVLGIGIIFIVTSFGFIYTKSKIKALFTGLIVATHPRLVLFSCEMLRENSFLIFIVISSIFLYMNYKNDSFISFILSAFFFGAAFLCRYEALELLILVVLSCFFAHKKRSFYWSSLHLTLYLFIFALSLILFSAIMNIPATRITDGFFIKIDNINELQ